MKKKKEKEMEIEITGEAEKILMQLKEEDRQKFIKKAIEYFLQTPQGEALYKSGIYET